MTRERKGSAQPALLASASRQIGQPLDGHAVGQCSEFLGSEKHQLGGSARSLGDDLAAVQGVLAAQPVCVPARRQVAAQRVPVVLPEPVRKLIEDAIQAGILVQLLLGSGEHLSLILTIGKSASTVGGPDSEHRACQRPTGVAVQPDPAAKAGCELPYSLWQACVDRPEDRLNDALGAVEAFREVRTCTERGGLHR